MQRQQLEPRPQPHDVAGSLAPVEAVDLRALALTARTPGAEGRDAHAALHRALATLAPTVPHGEALRALLDEGAFRGLVAEDGTETRLLAVEALLRLGYPWALHIHPDELAWYRGATTGFFVGPRRALRLRLVTTLALSAATLVASWLGWLPF